MSNLDIELPNLNVDVSDSVNKTLVVLRQPSGVVVRSSTPMVSVAESAVTASYALTSSVTLSSVSASYAITASHALNASAAPLGTISSSAQITSLGFISQSTIPSGTVSSSQQIINYNRFATTASNTFSSDQVIRSTGSVTIGISGNITGSHQFADNVVAPFVQIESADGMEATVFETFQLFQHNDAQGFFGFTIDANKSGYGGGWSGPAIGGDDGLDNYPVFIGFQDKTNYTDGRVTVLTPLAVSASIVFPDETTQTTAFTGIPQGTVSASAQISQSGFVSSSTINTIQTITSASYAAITPVSGTLYIIID